MHWWFWFFSQFRSHRRFRFWKPSILLNNYIDCFDFLTVPIASLVSIFLTVPLDQSFDSWLSNLPLISNFPCAHQLIVPIHPWSILNQPVVLLSKFFLWFRFFSRFCSINPSTVDCQIFLLFKILICDHQLIVPIHPWSIINQPGVLLSKLFLWFRFFSRFCSINPSTVDCQIFLLFQIFVALTNW